MAKRIAPKPRIIYTEKSDARGRVTAGEGIVFGAEARAVPAELVKSTIKENGRHKVIDKLTVELNDKGGFYEAEFTNLGLKRVPGDL